MTKDWKNAIRIHGSRKNLCLAESPKLHLYVFSRPVIFSPKPFECFGIAVLEGSGHHMTIFYLKTFHQRSFFLSQRDVEFLKIFKRKKLTEQWDVSRYIRWLLYFYLSPLKIRKIPKSWQYTDWGLGSGGRK